AIASSVAGHSPAAMPALLNTNLSNPSEAAIFRAIFSAIGLRQVLPIQTNRTFTSSFSATGGRPDRPHDVHVARAAADVALDAAADLLLARARIALEQVCRADQHAGGAVAALERVVRRERLLERRQPAVVAREPLDGRDP